MMTSFFTRIIIVLAILRQALGHGADADQPDTHRAGDIPDVLHDGAGVRPIPDAAIKPYLDRSGGAGGGRKGRRAAQPYLAV